MKEKDLSAHGETGKNEKKDPRAKKLGDKIGPVNSGRNRERHPNDSKKDGYRDEPGENRNGGKQG